MRMKRKMKIKKVEERNGDDLKGVVANENKGKGNENQEND